VSAHKKGKTKPPEPFPVPERTRRESQAAKPGSFAFIVNKTFEAMRKKQEQKEEGS